MDHGAYLKSVFGLEGKTAMITGAAGGIGAAISEGLAYAGAEVALCGRTLEKCQALADRINANGGKATAYHLDVSDMSEIVPRVEEIVARYGKIDVLFNVAGINKREGLLDVEEETYDRIMNTNLKGVYFVRKGMGKSYLSGLKKGISLCASKEGREQRVHFKLKRLPFYLWTEWELLLNTLRRLCF